MERILVTGAGGFVGGQLVKKLKESTDSEINILLRSVTKASRISPFPLNYFMGSVTEEASIKKAMSDCNIVVHCAHDFSRPDANLAAADLVAKQCLQQGVKKLIYISSFAVHDCNSQIINENSPLNDHWAYAINKTQIENRLVNLYKSEGLPVIILRPTIIYGPFSPAWTIYTIDQLVHGRLVIPFGGERICNAVHIDDVVAAIIKAFSAPASCQGNAYIVSGPDTVSWKIFYDEHLSYPGTNAPVYLDSKESESWQKRLETGTTMQQKDSLTRDPISFLKKTPLYSFYQNLLKNPFLKKKLLSAKATIPRPLIYMDKDAFETHSCKGIANISKIKQELGFEPVIPFQAGIKKTLLWIKWANLNLD